ncbi:hypothetical protein [Flavobacterium succinicans]|nr:hypothetical protein [Flavobacterium succinicans]
MFSIDGETGEETLLYTWCECSGSSQPEQVPPGDGGGGEPVSCGPGYIQDEYGNCVVDDQIIVELTGKVKCIYDKLMNSNSGFKNAIQKFDGEFPVSHLKFINTTSLPNNINATTHPPLNYLITIEVNDNNLSRPNLSIARTLIHETIHAEMFRKILSILENGGDLNGLTIDEWNQKLSNGDYLGIYDYYSRFGINGMQHKQMAAHYRTTISDYLKEFQPGLSESIYASLAWEGLKGTTSWNLLPLSEKNAINVIIANFEQAGSEDCN